VWGRMTANHHHCLRQTRSVCARELATKLQSNFALKQRSNPALRSAALWIASLRSQ
jgi:hypothetical protein